MNEKALYQLMSVNPIDVDSLLQLSGLDSATLYMGLLELELAGRLDRHPGGAVSLIP